MIFEFTKWVKINTLIQEQKIYSAMSPFKIHKVQTGLRYKLTNYVNSSLHYVKYNQKGSMFHCFLITLISIKFCLSKLFHFNGKPRFKLNIFLSSALLEYGILGTHANFVLRRSLRNYHINLTSMVDMLHHLLF